MPPKVIQRPDRGVLPVNASARAPKPPAARLKLEIRRLPPGLTLSEFEETLGEEWKLGNGKVDWREYRPGKVKSAAKLPQQSRCYVHLKSEDLVREFEARFLAVVFHDKAGTHKSPELKALPPTLGFAPNQRTPLHAKQRADNRQGTIDQEPEFIAFLEAETQPITKPSALDPLVEKDKEKEVVKSTPLIDDLREKKANKAKAAASKAEKEKEKKEKARSEGKENDKAAKESAKSSKKESVPAVKQGGKASARQSGKQTEKESEKAVEETKAATPASTKKAQSKTQKSAATPTQPTAATTAAGQSEKSTGSPAPQRQRQRGNNLEGIKKQLHKDLGVKASSGPKEKASKDTAQPQASKAASTEQPAKPTPTAPAASTKPAAAASSGKESTSASNSTNEANKHRAYLKHANPSQGMTEVLIQQALATYGDLTNVTIDPRKGTAIAVFKDAEGLKKAIEAKKVTVASGAVEIHPFRSERGGGSGGGGGNSGGNRGSRGRGRGGRAGGGGGGGGTANESQGAASGKGEAAAS